MGKGLPGGLGNIKVPSERGSGTAPNRPSMDAGRQRRLWEIDVRRGKLTPDRAEELAAQAGQPPFVRVTEQDRLAVQAAHWPLTLAIFWTAWEDVDQVARTWASFRFWKGHVWQNQARPAQISSLVRAEFTVFDLLKTGKIACSGRLNGIRQTVWPEFWIEADWKDPIKRDTIVNGASILDAMIVPKINGQENRAPTPTETGSEKKGDENLIKNRGGAPFKWDWDAMWIEIIRLHDLDLVKERAALTATITRWFMETYNAEPPPSEIRKRMKRLYESMGW